jgi:hypothetical protein
MEDKEKNEIQDAEVVQVAQEVNIEETKNNYRTEIILILIIGLLLGVMIKAEALKTLSIGFSDYKVKGGTQAYDTVTIEKKMKEEAELKKAQAQEAAKEAQKNGTGAPAQTGTEAGAVQE